MNKKLPNQGMIVPTMIFIMLAVTVSAIAVGTFVINNFARVNRTYFSTNALLSAEAGAEQALYELNQDSTFTGHATEQEYFSNAEQGRGTYQTQIIGGNISNEKLIVATGRLYRRISDSEPAVTRKIRLTVVGTTSDSFSVQTGPGGLIMNNSATIANGDVHVNGTITMSNSSRIGSASNPLNVYAAHVACPTAGGATYPSLCEGGEPISMPGTQAHIYGEVRATNQTNGAKMSNPGLITNSSAEAVALPSHDRQAQQAAISQEITGTAASCNSNQTRTYQANTKINGDVAIRNNCQVTVLGNIWITGSLTLENSSRIRVDNALTQSPYMMVDGSSISVQNSASILANDGDFGFWFVTYRSAAACSPDCADVTGVDLYNSRNINTITLNNTGLAAGSVFYARWTKVTSSQSGSVGGVVGQTVQLDNTGNISFGTELSSGETIWSIKNYTQIFD